MSGNSIRREWGTALAVAMKRWAKQERYQYIKVLATELGIEYPVFSRIASGKSIAKENELYARIFARTGLKEADPRTIPPMERKLNEKVFVTEMAWSDDQLEKWLEEEGGKYLPKRIPISQAIPDAPPVLIKKRTSKEQGGEVKSNPDPVPTVERDIGEFSKAPPGSTFQDELMEVILRHFIQSIGRTLVEPILLHITKELDALALRINHEMQIVFRSIDQEKKSSGTFSEILSEIGILKELIEDVLTRPDESETKPNARVIKTQTSFESNPKHLIQKLRAAIDPVLRGTIEDRDRFVEMYGDDFGSILSLVQAFSSHPEKREQTLRLSGEVIVNDGLD